VARGLVVVVFLLFRDEMLPLWVECVSFCIRVTKIINFASKEREELRLEKIQFPQNHATQGIFLDRRAAPRVF